MKENKILIGNIQRMCVNDGPGIRTTIFLKGCNLNCPWCANPENKENRIQYFVNKDKCIAENNSCIINNLCSILKKSEITNLDENRCLLRAISHYGNFMSENEILNIILKDKIYYDNDGGITFSGGEPLTNSYNIKNLCNKIKEHNISICMETSLFASPKLLLNIINDIDLFIIDIKNLVKDECFKYLNGNIDLYYKNIEILVKHEKKFIFRIPVIEKYIYNYENNLKIIDLIKKYKPLKVELFKVHNLGKKKYSNLNLKYIAFNPIRDDEIKKLKLEIEKLGVKVEIIKF